MHFSWCQWRGVRLRYIRSFAVIHVLAAYSWRQMGAVWPWNIFCTKTLGWPVLMWAMVLVLQNQLLSGKTRPAAICGKKYDSWFFNLPSSALKIESPHPRMNAPTSLHATEVTSQHQHESTSHAWNGRHANSWVLLKVASLYRGS